MPPLQVSFSSHTHTHTRYFHWPSVNKYFPIQIVQEGRKLGSGPHSRRNKNLEDPTMEFYPILPQSLEWIAWAVDCNWVGFNGRQIWGALQVRTSFQPTVDASQCDPLLARPNVILLFAVTRIPHSTCIFPIQLVLNAIVIRVCVRVYSSVSLPGGRARAHLSSNKKSNFAQQQCIFLPRSACCFLVNSTFQAPKMPCLPTSSHYQPVCARCSTPVRFCYRVEKGRGEGESISIVADNDSSPRIQCKGCGKLLSVP